MVKSKPVALSRCQHHTSQPSLKLLHRQDLGLAVGDAVTTIVCWITVGYAMVTTPSAQRIVLCPLGLPAVVGELESEAAAVSSWVCS